MGELVHQVEPHAHADRGAVAVGLDMGPGRGLGEILVARHPDGAQFAHGFAEFRGFHIVRILSDTAVQLRDQRAFSSSPYSPSPGTLPSKRAAQNFVTRLTKLPSTSARSLLMTPANCSQVKLESEPSGALAIR